MEKDIKLNAQFSYNSIRNRYKLIGPYNNKANFTINEDNLLI